MDYRDLHNEYDYLTSRSTSEEPVIVTKKSPISKRNRNSKANARNVPSVAHNNNKIKKNSRSIIVPVSSQNCKEFQSIKIVNSGSTNIKSANIKAAAANLLKKSKQGLVQKNIFVKQEILMEDDDDDYEDEEFNYDDIMKETDKMLEDHDDDDDVHSSAESNSSSYPKLVLTNEEKRLLNKEGISLPEFYPLTKHEERELKRIRRKIRNKISAQDSRKRKKEYIDGLEERVKQCTDENNTLVKRIKLLQNQNHDLMSKMKKLQMLLNKTGSNKTAQPATCLMILILSLSLVALPNLKLSKDILKHNDLSSIVDQQTRRSLLFDLKSLEDSVDLDEMSFIPNDHDYIDKEKSSPMIVDTVPMSPYERKRTDFIDYDIDPVEEINWSLKRNLQHLNTNEDNSTSQHNMSTTSLDELNDSQLLADIIQLPSQIIQESSKA